VDEYFVASRIVDLPVWFQNVYGEAQLQFVRKTKVGVVKFEQSNENHRPSGQIALKPRKGGAGIV